MKKLIVFILLSLIGSTALAEEGESSGGGGGGGRHFGINVGLGIPYVTQVGANYVIDSKFSAAVGYNNLHIGVDKVTADMTKLEATVRFHPMEGSFFVGAGLGRQTLSATSTETISGQAVDAKVEVKAFTLTPELGWMWGIDDAGFFFGMDFGFQIPLSPEATVSTNASAAIQTDPTYQTQIAEVREQARKYGEISIPTFTFLRVGYLF